MGAGYRGGVLSSHPGEDVADCAGGAIEKGLMMWILMGLTFAVALVSGVSVTILIPVALAIALIWVLGLRALIGLLGGLMLLFRVIEQHSPTLLLMALGLAASAVIVFHHNWPHLQPTRLGVGAGPPAARKSKGQVAARDVRPPRPEFHEFTVRDAGIDEMPSSAVPMTVEDAQKSARASSELIEPREDTWPLDDDHEATGARGGMQAMTQAARNLFFLPARADDE